MPLPKVSFIMPVYKTSYKYLAGSIPAIVDQDIPDWEIIICLDGPNKKAREFITSGEYFNKQRENLTAKQRKEFITLVESRMTIIQIKHGGAPAARNAAAAKATGDYIISNDPDIYWYPGAIRELIEGLESHPEHDFVYGSYDIIGGQTIHAREFSRLALRSTNYISGAFPVRRSKYVQWDPAMKSLQDYDFWLSLTDKGSTGLFIDKSFFITEPAGEFISTDSRDNWLDRMDQIKTKHGYPKHDIVTSSLGAELHALHAADKIGADYLTMPSFKPNRYKKIYLFGFYPQSANDHFKIFMKNLPQEGGAFPGWANAKKIIHWIGSDIRGLRRSVGYEQLKDLVATFKKNDFIHLCEAKFTQKKLKDVGIQAKVVPIPPKFILDPMPLPSKFTVAIYENPTQPDIYMPGLMAEVARSMPDIKFKFFGDKNNVRTDKNVEHIGWVEDMPKFISSCSAILRCTTSDGLPLSPIEFMLAGRQAITNVPVKFAKDCEPNRESVVRAIRTAQHKPTAWYVSKYWHWVMSPERYRKSIEAL